MKRRTILALVFLGAVAITGAFFARGIMSDSNDEAAVTSPRPKQPAVVKVVSAIRGEISDPLALTGTVVPYRVARLASPAEGPVGNIKVREGDRVKPGEVLMAIGRKKGVEALIASLREELRVAEDNLQRIRRLVEKKALPQEELDEAHTAYERVRAELTKAEETARDHAIVAPWEGVVSHLLVHEGAFVAPRAVLLEIYDPSSLVIRAAAPEKQAVAVQAGLGVKVRLDSYPDQTYPARIERVYPYLDFRLRTRTIEILLEEPVPLLPGMFARLTVLLKTVGDAVVIPLEALQSTPEGEAVFVVKDGQAVRRKVKSGLEEGGLIQIEAGLAVGDLVIIKGHEGLKDGVAVRWAQKEKEDKHTPAAEGDRK